MIVGAAVAGVVIAALASHGAYFSQSWGWVALAFLVPTTVLLILDRVSAPGRLRIAFASLMGALGLWIALSTLWSISPTGSAREIERVLVYVAAALAIALVLRRGDGPAVASGTLVGVTGIVAYGLATRLFPDRLGVAEDAFNAYRLAEPIGYWNAFGAVAAIGVVLALGAVTHARRALVAAAAGATLPALAMALYFAFSRGSWLSLFFALAAVVVLDARRVTLLWSLAVVLGPSALGVAVASRQDALTGASESAADAVAQGHRLAWLLLVLVPVSAALAWLAHRGARRLPLTGRTRRALVIGLASLVALGVLAALVSVGGPSAGWRELRDEFESGVPGGQNLNDRLFSLSANGRDETIRVAFDTGTDHALGGAGAGTFQIVWYENRPSQLIVRDAHSLYVETFAELGIVGLTLLVAALLVPLVAAVRARRSRFVAPACGAYLVWVSSAALDWHWEMVGLTTTAFLAGAVGLVAAERRQGGTLLSGSRLAIVGVTATMSLVAVWSLVGNQALAAGQDAVEDEQWSEARDHARRARALLVWSHEPEFVLGDAYAGLGDRERALEPLRDAAQSDPRNWIVWYRLALVERGAERDAALERMRELNPLFEGRPGG